MLPDFISYPDLVPYPKAMAQMEDTAARVAAGAAPDQVWFLEHPPTYTAGTSAKPAGLVMAGDIPVYETGRGGEHTYHGPGQLVIYPILTLAHYYPSLDLRRYVFDLEEWIILGLATLGVKGERRSGRVGIWVVDTGGHEVKIAALGIRVRRGVAMHGASINLDPDLAAYNGIIPCGIHEFGVTSLVALGVRVTRAQLEEALKSQFSVVFRPTRPNFLETAP
jgi:lipoyl(octanoyl) transferase